MSSVDLLYVSYNRRAYTIATFEALLANTDWSLVGRLYVNDDGSVDGTWDYLCDRLRDVPAGVVRRYGAHAGPVAATNWYLDASSEIGSPPPVFAKIDNDLVVCPGWLEEMLVVLESEQLDIVGMEPWDAGSKLGLVVDDPQPAPFAGRRALPCEHIGGKGLLRRDGCFPHGRRMAASGYFGFTGFQTSHPEFRIGWIAPDLPVFGLDQMPAGVGPWHDLALEYAREGWQRLNARGELLWGTYSPRASAYWDWWVE